MLNFTHKCSTSDVSKSKKIAKRVNNRLTTYINPLSFLNAKLDFDAAYLFPLPNPGYG